MNRRAYHAQSHTLIRVSEVGQDLRCSGDCDASLMPKLVKSTLHAEISKPVLAVRSSTRHRP